MERPNVLIILADDMGYSDIGCFGSEIKTPNIDDLASGGAIFTQFYNAARCCPSRASLLTGLYSHQVGIGLMDGDLGVPSYQGYLNNQCVTLAEVLKSKGYSTYGIGKWHVGTKDPYWPAKRGFEKFYGSSTSMGHYFGLLEGRNLIVDDESVVPEGDTVVLEKFRYLDIEGEKGKEWYATDAYSDYAVKYLEDHSIKKEDTPFFMYLAYTAPHWPLHALPEDVAKYDGVYDVGWDVIRENRLTKMIRLGILEEGTQLSPKESRIPSWSEVENKQEITREMEVYAAMIDRMDQGIGKVVKKLKELGEYENTVIVFLSDNGGCPFGPNRSEPGAEIGDPNSYQTLGFGWANASNTPFRFYKQYTHEGGISSPLIVSYPKKIASRIVSHEPAHILDVFPTILDFTGLEYPAEYDHYKILPLEGKSLISPISSKSLDRTEPLFWEHMGNKAIRKDNWKLVMSDQRKGWELYDMSNDRTEINNLINSYPERVLELKNSWYEWAIQSGVMEIRQSRGGFNLRPLEWDN